MRRAVRGRADTLRADTLRADSSCGLRAGTVISSTAVRTAVVGALGELPAA